MLVSQKLGKARMVPFWIKFRYLVLVSEAQRTVYGKKMVGLFSESIDRY